MSGFDIKVLDDRAEIRLNVNDKAGPFSRKERAELEERLRRRGRPGSDGVLTNVKFKIKLDLCDLRRPLENLKILERGLHEIREADLFNRCTSMDLRFPPISLDIRPEEFKDLGRLTLPYLETLLFIGHRTQFPMVFGLGKTPPRLHHLTLSCEITMCDCAYFLNELSDTLRTLTVKRLTLSNFWIPSMFPGFRSHLIKGRVRMTALESFEIEGLFVNPTEMLNKFEMWSLRRFRLNQGKRSNRTGITKKDLKWIPWRKVTDTDVPDV